MRESGFPLVKGVYITRNPHFGGVAPPQNSSFAKVFGPKSRYGTSPLDLQSILIPGSETHKRLST